MSLPHIVISPTLYIHNTTLLCTSLILTFPKHLFNSSVNIYSPRILRVYKRWCHIVNKLVYSNSAENLDPNPKLTSPDFSSLRGGLYKLIAKVPIETRVRSNYATVRPKYSHDSLVPLSSYTVIIFLIVSGQLHYPMHNETNSSPLSSPSILPWDFASLFHTLPSFFLIVGLVYITLLLTLQFTINTATRISTQLLLLHPCQLSFLHPRLRILLPALWQLWLWGSVSTHGLSLHPSLI